MGLRYIDSGQIFPILAASFCAPITEHAPLIGDESGANPKRLISTVGDLRWSAYPIHKRYI